MAKRKALGIPIKPKEYKPELSRKHKLKANYNLSGDDYAAMLERQNNVCAICHGPPKSRHKNLHVDHCHASTKVRGLLCHTCNGALGMVRDDIDTLKRMIEYITSAR